MGASDKTDLDFMEIGPRVRRALSQNGITSVCAIKEASDLELLGISGFGRGSLNELRAAVATFEKQHPDRRAKPMADDMKLPAQKQAEIVKAVKHLLSLAHAGRIVAIGYAVLNFDEDGDISAGTNAAWAGNTQIREGLKTAIATLSKRIGAKSAIIMQ